VPENCRCEVGGNLTGRPGQDRGPLGFFVVSSFILSCLVPRSATASPQDVWAAARLR